MQVPQYQQRVGVPRLREQVNPEAEQLGAIARFGESVTAISADIATRIVGVIKHREVNQALMGAKESWYEFYRNLEDDDDYQGYEEKFKNFRTAQLAEQTKTMKLASAKKAFKDQFDAWAIDAQEEVITLARSKIDAGSRATLTTGVDQATIHLDDKSVNRLIDEAIDDGIVDVEDGEKIRSIALKEIARNKARRLTVQNYGYEAGIAELNKNRDYYRKTWNLTDDELDHIIERIKGEWSVELDAKDAEFRKLNRGALITVSRKFRDGSINHDFLDRLFAGGQITETQWRTNTNNLNKRIEDNIKLRDDKITDAEKDALDAELDRFEHSDPVVVGEIVNDIIEGELNHDAVEKKILNLFGDGIGEDELEHLLDRNDKHKPETGRLTGVEMINTRFDALIKATPKTKDKQDLEEAKGKMLREYDIRCDELESEPDKINLAKELLDAPTKTKIGNFLRGLVGLTGPPKKETEYFTQREYKLEKDIKEGSQKHFGATFGHAPNDTYKFDDGRIAYLLGTTWYLWNGDHWIVSTDGETWKRYVRTQGAQINE